MRIEHQSRGSIEHQSPPTSPPRSDSSLALMRAVDLWLADGRAQGWSERTLQDRREGFRRVAWWLENEAQVSPTLHALTRDRIRLFLAYLREPHPEGRFGCRKPTAKRAARPFTLLHDYRNLHAFGEFCVREELLVASPLQNLKPPRTPKDQIQPFSPAQVQALLDAAQRSHQPERNRALLWILLDSGLRISEVCSLRVTDVEKDTGEISVCGKGGKRRRVYLGRDARRAVRRYLEVQRRGASPKEPLFLAEGGIHTGEAMTRSGFTQLIRRLGRTADLRGVRCSPHTFRHTFAIEFLRGGGNVYELQVLMGHESLEILRRYVLITQADAEAAHRRASPGDRMKLR